MADIRIQTSVEGLQQALSDIQALRQQLEQLGNIQMQGGVSGAGGGAGGGGGFAAGGGNVAATATGLGGAPAAAIPPAAGNVATGAPTGPMTAGTVPGAPAPPSQQQLMQTADAMQQQMMQFANAGGQYMQSMGYQAGLGQYIQGAQMLSQLPGVGNLAGQFMQGWNTPTPPAGFPQMPMNQMAQFGFNARNFVMSPVGMHTIGGLLAIPMGGAVGSDILNYQMRMAQPQIAYEAQMGNRIFMSGMSSATPEDYQLANINRRFEEDIAAKEAMAGTLPFQLMDRLTGGLAGTVHRVQVMQLRRQQQFEAERFQRVLAPTYEMERLYAGGSAADFRRFRNDLQRLGASAEDDQIANAAIVAAGREIGLGAEQFDEELASSPLADIDRLTPEERTRSLAGILGNAQRNVGARGSMGQMTEAALNAALATGDVQAIRAYGAVSAGLRGRRGSAASDAEYRRVQEAQERMTQLQYGTDVAMGQRELSLANVNLIRSGGMGVGAATDEAILGQYAGLAGTYDPQIQQLQAQIAMLGPGAQNQVMRRQYEAQLQNVRAAQLQARDQQYQYADQVTMQQERLFGTFAQGTLARETLFGTMGGREAAMQMQLLPAQSEVSRLSARLGRMYSGQESYTQEKEREVTEQLIAAQTRLMESTVRVEEGVANMHYAFQDAARNISGTSAQIKAVSGYGGVSQISEFQDIQRQNVDTMHTATHHVNRLRSMGVAEDSPEMLAAKQKLSQAQLQLAQLPIQQIQAPYTAASQDVVSEGRFAMRVLDQLPGGFGVRRELMGQQMGALGQQRAELDEMYAAAQNMQGGVTPQMRLAYNERRRAILGEQIGILGEASYGWQNRLMSAVSGAPDMSAITPQLATRIAIGEGIRNPFFGGTQGSVEDALESSMLFGTLAGSQSAVGNAATAFSRAPSTVQMGRGLTGGAMSGVTLQVSVNGLPGTGTFRAATGPTMPTDPSLLQTLTSGQRSGH